MNLKLLSLFSLFSLIAGGLLLPPNTVYAYPDACGNDTTAGRLVPDKPLKYNFGPACATHDSCYARAIKTREQCDREFRDNLVAVCETTPYRFGSWSGWNLRNRLLRRGCLGLAYTYFGAVSSETARIRRIERQFDSYHHQY